MTGAAEAQGPWFSVCSQPQKPARFDHVMSAADSEPFARARGVTLPFDRQIGLEWPCQLQGQRQGQGGKGWLCIRPLYDHCLML